MHKLGLKLWSVNTDFYLKEAESLFDKSVYDYIELYIVPDTLDTLNEWKKLKIPFILHNAHSAHGFNLAQADKRLFNRHVYEQTAQFADVLKAEYIIFHGGIDGNVEETASQLAAFNESRALIENKPFVVLPGGNGTHFCRGATPEEIAIIIELVSCGFCLDFGHAICSANSQGIEPYSYISQFIKFRPQMFHLSDVSDMKSPYDAHPHLGTGMLDIARLKRDFLLKNAMISIETNKNYKDNLSDFAQDTEVFRNV